MKYNSLVTLGWPGAPRSAGPLTSKSKDPSGIFTVLSFESTQCIRQNMGCYHTIIPNLTIRYPVTLEYCGMPRSFISHNVTPDHRIGPDPDGTTKLHTNFNEWLASQLGQPWLVRISLCSVPLGEFQTRGYLRTTPRGLWILVIIGSQGQKLTFNL